MKNRFCLTTRCNGTSEAVNSNLVNTLVTKLDTTWFRHFQFYMKLSRYVHEGKAHAWMVRTSKSCASWKDSPGRLTNMVALSWLGGSQQTKSEMFSDNATFEFFFLGGGAFLLLASRNFKVSFSKGRSFHSQQRMSEVCDMF